MKKTLPEILPVSNSVFYSGLALDTYLGEAMKELGLISIFTKMGIKKRSGLTSFDQIIFAVMIIPLLGIETIFCFCGKFLDVYIPGGKDVIYDFLKRQNINYSLIATKLALKFASFHFDEYNELQAFVIDDTVKKRRGKKVEAMSSHFEHAESRHVMG